MRTLSDRERHAWVRLARSENVGPVTFAGLIARFGNAEAALGELPRMAARGGGKKFDMRPETDVAREIAELARLGGRLIASCEPDFPQGLAALDPPENEKVYEAICAQGVSISEMKRARRRRRATLTESAEDVLAVLTPIMGSDFREPDQGEPGVLPDPTALEAEADQVRHRIEETLGPAPVAVDELIRQTGAPVAAVLTVLLELELAGRCRRHPGNFVSWS